MPRTRPSTEESAELFPIRTVSSLTGVNAITLRAWERRHGLVNPVRTESGHRLFRQADIDLIHRIQELLAKGLSIGQVKRALADHAPVRQSAQEQVWDTYRERIIGAVSRFDEQGLDDIYNAALGLHPIETVTQSLLLPVLRELGERWARRDGSVAEEHFFSVYLRSKLGARFHHRTRRSGVTRVLAACLPGEQHEIGLLIFALAAHERGFETVLLAANTPIEDLPLAVRRAKCAALVLSTTVQPVEEILDRQLPALVAAAQVPVLVGGTASIAARDAIVAAGGHALGTDIGAGIQRLHAVLEAA